MLWEDLTGGVLTSSVMSDRLRGYLGQRSWAVTLES
jgi:hypothetical protein